MRRWAISGAEAHFGIVLRSREGRDAKGPLGLRSSGNDGVELDIGYMSSGKSQLQNAHGPDDHQRGSRDHRPRACQSCALI